MTNQGVLVITIASVLFSSMVDAATPQLPRVRNVAFDAVLSFFQSSCNDLRHRTHPPMA